MSDRPRRTKSKIDAEIVHDAGHWPDEDEVRSLVEATAAEVAIEPRFALGRVSVTVALSDDASVAALNGQFRAKPEPTNVLSFPPGPGAPGGHIGDIVLAVETVGREADEQDISFEHHFQHLIVHGILHLLGMDHDSGKDAGNMEKLEIQILARLGVANPYTGALERDKT